AWNSSEQRGLTAASPTRPVAGWGRGEPGQSQFRKDRMTEQPSNTENTLSGTADTAVQAGVVHIQSVGEGQAVVGDVHGDFVFNAAPREKN
ncbi:hypothetical protein ACFC1B_30205, partial [Streptomyces xiamenensis]|uniref:hypothetical protein n=1 Tax=Streptomyces xiamenensis TaxID=408015 RepID=UPI0035D65497